ncbi:MAG TPA: response regulator [Labilithrix sp.]|jgi:DNA-binding response OmpR family regulator
MQAEQAQKQGSSRLGGARADFVGSLGRKLRDLLAALGKVREEPLDLARREELRRKLHALGTSAKLMKFDAMDRAIAEALGTLDKTGIDEAMDPVDLAKIEQVLEDLPALAWGESPSRLQSEEPPKVVSTPTWTALVVGPPVIAEALLEDGEGRPTFGCDSTPSAQAAFDLAIQLGPDLVLVDADIDDAGELVEALLDDKRTESTPIVVLGSFLEPGDAEHFVAMGVAKTVAKPTSRDALRTICEKTLEKAPLPEIHTPPPSSETRMRGAEVPAERGGREGGPMNAGDVRLQGRRIVVADDDPSVVWFLADTLKAAGCNVAEAFDGEQALDAAYRTNPELVIADILMPKIDGMALCRAFRKDVALRDVPVILLSWKEDLLQRTRELGAGAAGYLRKETDARAVLARVREALRARSLVEARLREDGEVRGRLDGVSVRTLLDIVCSTRPEARVAVRDASFLYEVEVRDGAPLRATRTAGDGSLVRGTRVLAAMLGVGAGRFTVTPSSSTVDAELDGNLAAQLAKPLARARASTMLLSGPAMKNVDRVLFDEDALDEYLRATPETARDIVRRLSRGEAPRALVLEGACDVGLLEDIMCDLAARGFVVGVEGFVEQDLLGPEIARLMQCSDNRAAFAPKTATPAPEQAAQATCSPDPGDVCESPSPPAPMDDAVMRELAQRSPTPIPLSLPADFSPVGVAEALAKSPEPREIEGTPTYDQIVALAEPTIVDDTCYGAIDPSIPIHEASQAIDLVVAKAPDPERNAKTPLTSVRASEPKAEPTARNAGRKAWPMVAFIAATALVTWVVMRHSAEQAPKAPEAAPPAAVETVPQRAESDTPEVSLPPGQGLLEIAAPADAPIVVDGTERGRGVASVQVSAGAHEVRIKSSAGEDGRSVDVRAGKIARVKF